MRIIVNGMQPFGTAVLEKLVERGEEIVGVYCPADKDGRADKLTEAARAHGLPVFQPKSFKTAEAVEHVKSLRPDLAVMAYVLKHTAWGRHVYAIGDDPEAASLSGVRTNP